MYDDPIFPEKLRNIRKPPKQLYYKGNINLLNEVSIAIIGSRCSSDYGITMASIFSQELTQRGIVIISGMAKGIDGAAHKNCIEAGGKTIAVLGCGVNVIYPKENTSLYYDILRNDGLIISEYEPNTEADTKYFPQRNRIVSALSIGTLVIESAYRSGTSITAKLAIEQGKKVFCVPHPLETITGVGNNRLIQEGAKLVTCVDDIIQEYDFLNKGEIKKENILIKREVKDEYKALYETLTSEAISVNSICKKLKCKVSDLNYLITMMEIENLIEVLPGNMIKRK